MKAQNQHKNTLKKILGKFDDLTKSPLDYLKEQKEHAEKNRLLVKSLFDYAKPSGKHFASNSIPDELYVSNMDEEQIWQQLELQNESFWSKCLKETCRLLSVKEDKLALNIQYANGHDANGSDADVEHGEDLNGDDINGGAELHSEDESESDGESDDESDSEQDSDDENNEQDGEHETENVKSSKKGNRELYRNKGNPSEVDDNFFNLNEMEAYLDGEDKKELDRLNGKSKNKDDTDDDDSDNEIDYFNDITDDDESAESDNENEKQIKFSDFFDAEEEAPETLEQRRERRKQEREEKNKRKAKQAKEDLGLEDSEPEESSSDENPLFESDDDDDAEQEPEEEQELDDEQDNDDEVNGDYELNELKKSDFELRQSRLQRRIEDLEEDAVGEKSWQLKGEIDSSSRPKNSLLEEILEFDSTVRPAPVITEETTLRLEDIIKRRIKSKAWDDVERKIKPINDQQEFRKKLVLNQEKSKESLAQIYEKDYLEKLNKINNIDTDASKPEEPPAHTDIRNAMKSLFLKLDALSNFHFTAKPVAIEARIITNVPAINMEEVAPVAVSDGALLAPEEIKARPKGDVIGKTERSNTDKNRERRHKKEKQKNIKKANDRKIEEKEKLGIKVTTKERQQQLLNQVTKSRNVIKTKNTSNDEKALKSSKAFFNQLQDNVSAAHKSKSNKKKKSSTDLSQQEGNAKRFKL